MAGETSISAKFDRSAAARGVIINRSLPGQRVSCSEPTTAWAAARRAMGMRYGEQLT